MARVAVNMASTSAAPAVELEDIQGLVRFAYKHHTEAVFLLLRVTDRAAAHAWLGRAPITDSVTREPPPNIALQVALTSEGLRALGVAEDLIDSFSPEFVEGMAGDPSRSRRLGDQGTSDPARWQWGSGKRIPHVAVLLYALPGLLRGLQQSLEEQLRAGFEITGRLTTANLDGVEPFGFVDGISQPELDWSRQRVVGDVAQRSYVNLSCLGEYLLGYPNEYGLYTPRPLLEPDRDAHGILPRAEDVPGSCDLGRNGSYLVLRQLRQDVPGFWQAVDRYAGGDARRREQLASAMVGRKLDGQPLVALQSSAAAAPAAVAAGGDNPQGSLNEFDYRSDPQGLRCPLGAHIRRANPRNADLPMGGDGILSRLMRTLGFDRQALEEDLVASTRFHRLLRRGREYGTGVTPAQALTGAGAGEHRGLHFVCLGANLQRQFEFVQSAWLMSTKFDGMRDESDPLLGNRLPVAAGMAADRFSVAQPNGPGQCLTGLPQFVTVLGGAYFFLPGIRALRFLSGAR
jgi:deferrochelatase/peroxidase EfeB